MKQGSFRKGLIIILALAFAAGCFGCAKKVDKHKSRKKTESETYRFVATYRKDEVDEDSLGDIRTEGDLNECDPGNMLHYLGFYRGLDYVTIVFDDTSPIDLHNAELAAEMDSRMPARPARLEGVIYRESEGKKYVTFKFLTDYYDNYGEHEQIDSVGNWSRFYFPISEDEPMSFYYVIAEELPPQYDRAPEIEVGQYIQRQEIEQSYWMDYRYDRITEAYSGNTGRWEREEVTDQMTNNMPLE